MKKKKGGEREGEEGRGREKSHKVIITQIITIIRREISAARARNIPPNHNARLRLGRLALLPPFIRRLLLLQLLIPYGRQRARYLLDIPARQLLDELLREILSPHGILRLLRLGCQQRDQRVGQLCELRLGPRLEEGDGGEVYRFGRVGFVADDDGGFRNGGAGAVQVDVADEVLSVGEVCVLLCAPETCAHGGLVFVIIIVVVVFAG